MASIPAITFDDSIDPDLGYKHLRPENPANEPFIWEVYDFISVFLSELGLILKSEPELCVPRQHPGPFPVLRHPRLEITIYSYFPPKYLPEFGPLHDGGTAANNPAEQGHWERKILWPSTAKAAAVVSIGTGCSQRLSSPRSTGEQQLSGGFISRIFKAILVDSFIARLSRAYKFSRSVDAQNSWRAFMNHLEDHVRADYFRMNLFFDGEEPALDDVEQMPDLPRQVHAQLHQNDCPAVARALQSAQFFFELDSELDHRHGTFRCHGGILCRSLSSLTLVHHLQTKYPTARFMLDNGAVLGNLSTEHCCGNCGFFRIDVAFELQHRDESIQIFLVFNNLFRRNVNGFPHPISWFEEQQQLSYAFGRMDHRPTSGARKCSCASAMGKRKRKVHFQVESPRKRQTL